MILLSATTPVVGADPRATVSFATACANCHEGECSGRLSFQRPPDATFTHIRQYAGPVDDRLARALYDALERMKTDCRYAPLPVVDAVAGLEEPELAAYRDPHSGAYFLPLGRLSAGDYRISGVCSTDSRLRIELADSDVDPWLDRCLVPAAGRFTHTFTLPDPTEAFLRLRPQKQAPVTRLRLHPLP